MERTYELKKYKPGEFGYSFPSILYNNYYKKRLGILIYNSRSTYDLKHFIYNN